MTFTCNYRLHRRAGWSALRPAIFVIYKAGREPTPYWW